MYRILSVSRNVRLLITRNDALAIAGYSVVSPRDPVDATLIVVQQRIDAVVIGHSVEPSVREPLIGDIRRLKPAMPIFFVYTAPYRGGEPLADVSVDVTNGPQTLIAAMQERMLRVA